MIYDAALFAGIGLTLAIMWVGVKMFGVEGGFAGFFIGAALFGFIAAKSGVELGREECVRYSSYVEDC